MTMREVDRRSRVSRRSFLTTAAAAAPALAATGALSPNAAWAEGGVMPPATLQTLVKVARDIYPHDMLADTYYVTAIKPWDTKAGKDPAVRAMLEDGVRRLDSDAQDRHKLPYTQVAWEADRVKLLQGIEHTEFFRKLRSDLVVSLYNQHELWPKFGYEGSSADKGGYIHRGFGDIDWLPTA